MGIDIKLQVAEGTLSGYYNTYDKKVVHWELNGIKSEIVKTLNEKLFNDYQALVEAEGAKLFLERKNEEATRQERIKIEREKKRMLFEEKVKPLIPEGYSFKIPYENQIQLWKDAMYIDIYHQDYGNSALLWKYSVDNRKHSSATVGKAIINATKALDELLLTRATQKKAAEEDAIKRNKAAESLKEIGLTFTTSEEWHSNRYGKSYSEHIEKVHVTITPKTETELESVYVIGQVSRDSKNEVTINNARVKGKMTPEQFKTLADFIKKLGIQRDY
jgi:hypothetical protein